MKKIMEGAQNEYFEKKYYVLNQFTRNKNIDILYIL